MIKCTLIPRSASGAGGGGNPRPLRGPSRQGDGNPMRAQPALSLHSHLTTARRCSLRAGGGQTERQLHQRLREHRRAVESGDCANSALAEHAWGCHHPVDWDRVRVLDCHPHLHQRLTLESVHIRSQSKPVNRDLGTMPQIYSPLFN